MNLKTAVIAASEYRQTVLQKKATCTLVDYFFLKKSRNLSNFRFGEIKKPELIKSVKINMNLGLRDILRALFIWRSEDFSDAKALWYLQSQFYLSPCKPQRWFPLVGYCHLPKWFWFSYALFGLKAFAVKASRFAKKFDQLWIVCFYDTRSLAFVRAFRKQGKPVVDIQHGLIGPTHAAYLRGSFWKKKSNLQPSSFIVWNRHSRNFVERETRRHAEVRPFDDRVYFKPQLRARISNKNVLITLSWGIDNVLPIEIGNYIQKNEHLNFIIRPHPRDKQSLLRLSGLSFIFKSKNVQFSLPTVPLIKCILNSKLHITKNSSVVIEAAQFGTKSFFWDKSISKSFQHEINCGMAFYVPLSRLPQEIDGFFKK